MCDCEDRSIKRCRTYKVCFPFDNDSPRVISLDEALLSLKDKKQLRADYGRYDADKILRQKDYSHGRD